MKQHEGRFPYRSIAFISVLLVAVVIGIGIALSQAATQSMRVQIQQRMMDVASSAAALLDGDALETFSADDQDRPEYQKAMSTLRAFQDNVELSYIYCVRERGDGTFEFTVDPTEGDPADFGEDVVVTEALEEAAAGRAATDFVAYEDRWGRFYSAYCPVFDSKGHVASVVTVDFAASWFDDRVNEINNLIVIDSVATLIVAAIAIFVAGRFSSQEARHIKSLDKANRYDALTGLAKMGHFFDIANEDYERMRAEGKTPAILFVDLVGMKYFNQQYGFAEGDKLLKKIAALLKHHFGAKHCSRLGQDHFAVSTDTEGLDARLDEFIDDAAHINDGKTLPLRIGIHPASMGDVEVSVACDRAKIASAATDTPQRSSYTYFDQAMLAKEEQRHYVVNNIDRAIEEGWIQVYYQPIVRAENGLVCDEESLARWIDPKLGFLSPAEFVPALEDAKLIYKLDLCVLEQSLQKMRRLADAGLYVVPSSINLSRSDFTACDMVEEVRKRVDESGIARSMINVEITETDMGRDFEFMKRQVERFHELGFRVWMDDFGSEYSSLDYLQNLTFDLIKLDMRFMKQFDAGNKSKVILTELVKMAIGLGIDTICEGVETREQADFLCEIGCNRLQGFYFSKPSSLDDILVRYEAGEGLGFENPDEAEYYASLGRVNLYDLSSVAREDEENLSQYFDTLPMALYEATATEFKIVRCNQAYRTYVSHEITRLTIGEWLSFEEEMALGEEDFLHALRTCATEGEHLAIDGVMPSGAVVHAFARRVAINPVTGVAALAVAVLSVG